MSIDSERSSGKNVTLKRKDSKDNGIEHNSSHHFQQINKKDSCHKLDGNNDRDHKELKEHKEHREHKENKEHKEHRLSE